jgi:hypothetical protein
MPPLKSNRDEAGGPGPASAPVLTESPPNPAAEPAPAHAVKPKTLTSTIVKNFFMVKHLLFFLKFYIYAGNMIKYESEEKLKAI